MPNLTNPALAYDQPPTLDSVTGMPITPAALIKFFKNPAVRAQQFAQDASQAVQPSTSTVEGTLGEPQISPVPMQNAGEVVPGPDQTTVGMTQPPAPILPKFFQPKFQDVSQGAYGLPTPVNAGETKLGKLLHIARALTEGGLAGSSQGTFGGGYEAARNAPYQDLSRNLGAESAILQNQQQRANLAMLPWQRAKMIADLQESQGKAAAAGLVTPREGGGVYNARTGKWDVTGQGRARSPDDQAFEARTRIAQGKPQPGDAEIVTAWQEQQQAKQDVKPDPAAKAADEYQSLLEEKYIRQGMDPVQAKMKAFEQRATLGPRTTFNLNQAASATATEETPIDPLSNSILAQTGLSIPAFYVLTGDMSKLSRDKATRAAAAKEAQTWANKHGVDISTLGSQYKTYNEVLGQNIARLNRTRIMEQELQGTIQNLQGVVTAKDLSRLKFANVLSIWAGQEVNDDLAQQYALHLFQLRNELAAYGAATQGRSGNEITITDQRDAENTIKNGIAKGSLEGLATAVGNSTTKMGAVMERSVDTARKGIWSLFGVGQNYKPSAGTQSPSAPKSGKFDVADPTGLVHHFTDQKSTDAFKKAAGIQ